MSFIRSLLNRRSLENPYTKISDPDEWLWEALGAKPSTSGVRVNRKTALSYPAVWRACNLIASDVGKLPLFVYRRSGEGKERDTTHPTYHLLRYKPNAEMTSFVFKQTIQGHALLEGNGYGYIFRNGDASAKEIVPLSPNLTYPVRENGRLWYVTQVGSDTLSGSSGELRKLKPQDVLHIKGIGFDGLVGYSVLEKARDSFGLGLAVAQYGARYFKNNARPGVIIEHPGRLSPAAAENLRKSWNAMHEGLNSAHKTAVLEEGMKAHEISDNARQAQLKEIREHELLEIANWFGLPPHKVGHPSRTAFASLEQENQSYLDECLDPWLVRWEEECRDKLLTEEEKENDTHIIEFLRQALVRADMQARFASYAIAVNNRIMNPNEVRGRENLNPYDGGDEFLIPLNMATPEEELEEKPEEQPAIESEEPEDDEGERNRLASLQRDILLNTFRRMVRRIGVQARAAAKKPCEFLAWLDDELATKQRQLVTEALESPMSAYAITNGAICRLDDKLIDRVRDSLLDVAGRCKAEGLPDGVDRCMIVFEDTADKLLTELLQEKRP